MSEKFVYLDNFEAEERYICEVCSAQGQDYLGIIPFPVCKIAQRIQFMEKEGNTDKLDLSRINTASIPEGCPNDYSDYATCEVKS